MRGLWLLALLTAAACGGGEPAPAPQGPAPGDFKVQGIPAQVQKEDGGGQTGSEGIDTDGDGIIDGVDSNGDGLVDMGGPTGEGVTGVPSSDGAGNAGCEALPEERSPLASLDDVVLLGPAASEYLLSVLTTHAARARWQRERAVVVDGIGETEVELSVQYAGGEIWHVLQGSCERVEVGVAATLGSADGVLELSFDATLRLEHPRLEGEASPRVTLYRAFEPAELGGELDVVVFEPEGASAEAFQFDAVLPTPGSSTFAGGLSSSLGPLRITYLGWPSQSLLGEPTEICQLVTAQNGAELVTPLVSELPLAAVWDDAAAGELGLAVELEHSLCMSNLDARPTATARVQVRATSVSPEIAGQWPAVLRVGGTLAPDDTGLRLGGPYEPLHVGMDAVVSVGENPNAFTEAFGYAGVDPAGFDALGLRLWLDHAYDSPGVRSGFVEVLGLVRSCPETGCGFDLSVLSSARLE